MQVMALIPARYGSKRIPCKNLALLGGKPLVAWSIEAARLAPSVTRVIVSTDGEAIAQAARAYGAEVPFLRPASLAEDASSPDQVFAHVLETLAEAEGYRPDLLLELYPTHPFRTPGLIEYAVHVLAQGCGRVETVRPLGRDELHCLTLDNQGRLRPVFRDAPSLPAFRPYGILVGRNLRPQPAAPQHLIPITDPISLIDIDYPEDLALANAVVAEGLFDFTDRSWPDVEAAPGS